MQRLHLCPHLLASALAAAVFMLHFLKPVNEANFHRHWLNDFTKLQIPIPICNCIKIYLVKCNILSYIEVGYLVVRNLIFCSNISNQLIIFLLYFNRWIYSLPYFFVIKTTAYLLLVCTLYPEVHIYVLNQC